MTTRTDSDVFTGTARLVSRPDRASRPALRSLERAGVTAPGSAGLSTPLSEPRSRAAQYIRMSTDHQQYSTANQCDAIADYARKHGLEVVRTYADEGRSGLTITGRKGLAALLKDVVEGQADYHTILVYDVSRWGRFQDSDEAAYYEFLCRRAGIHVEYCMEPFSNDGSAVSSMTKSLKRIMAGEYSRELSQKIFDAKCRTVRMGFRAGGIAGYGLRRMLLDASGRQRGVLQDGEQKYAQTDRVILVPGPPKELEVVRWIFRQVARHGTHPTAIARKLNQRGELWTGGKPWISDRVIAMLANEKYIGTLVFNKRSAKLKTPVVNNPPEQWIRAEGVFQTVVAPKVFWKAQAVMDTWSTRISNETALELLKALFERSGTLSSKLIDDAGGMPGSAFYRNRFGGLTHAYALVGYEPTRDYHYVRGYAWRRRRLAALRQEVAEKLRQRGENVEWESRIVMVVNHEIRLGILLARYHPEVKPPQWLAQIHVKPQPDSLLIARLTPEETAIQDYCLIPGGCQGIWLGTHHKRRPDERYASDPDLVLDLVTG